jgi:sugar lactone lactonase YvrE
LIKITRLDLSALSLGESPLWHPAEQAFYWVDGLTPALYRLDWKTRRIERQALPDIVGSITRHVDGRILLAFSRCFALVRFGEASESLFTPDDLPAGVRFNDSKCDRFGRLVAGTMDLAESHPIGAAYRHDFTGGFEEIDSGYTVFNGPCWSVDGRSLFMSDSAGMQVYRFDYDPANGRAANKSVWLQLDRDDGLPDGAAIDGEGRYWQARNGAGIVAVHEPDGQLADAIVLPTTNVTSLTFGGPDLNVLLVTSMNRPLPWQDHLDRDAGGTFLIEGLDVQGLEEPAFGATNKQGWRTT